MSLINWQVSCSSLKENTYSKPVQQSCMVFPSEGVEWASMYESLFLQAESLMKVFYNLTVDIPFFCLHYCAAVYLCFSKLISEYQFELTTPLLILSIFIFLFKGVVSSPSHFSNWDEIYTMLSQNLVWVLLLLLFQIGASIFPCVITFIMFFSILQW